MSSNTVGALRKFLEQFDDDQIVYGYEEVAGLNIDGEGPSAIIVVEKDGKRGGGFATGDYAWTSAVEPRLPMPMPTST